MNTFKPFPVHVRLSIRLPFFEVTTHLLNMCWESCVYEMMCFRIHLFKWHFEIKITSNPAMEIKRRKEEKNGLHKTSI
jgi:hypothetical protein